MIFPSGFYFKSRVNMIRSLCQRAISFSFIQFTKIIQESFEREIQKKIIKIFRQLIFVHLQ